MRRVLLLSGGAFKGAVQLAPIRRLLDEYGGLPDEIRGTSVGSINGVMAAQDRLDELTAIWDALDDPHALNGVKGFLKATPLDKDGFWSLDPMEDMLTEKGVIPSRLKTVFGCGIWLPETDAHTVLTWDATGPLRHGVPLRKGVKASAAIAGLFAGVPLEWKGKQFIAADGGHEHVLPPAPAWVQPGDCVDAVFCHPVEPGIITHPRKEVDGRIERLILAADKGTHAASRGDFETLKALAKSGVKIRVYAPREDPGGMLDASKETIAFRKKLGERMAAAPIWSFGD